MTNEEKAKELASSERISFDELNDSYCNGIECGALEMAEWKDKEFDAKINYLHDIINDKIDFEKAYFVVTGINWRR